MFKMYYQVLITNASRLNLIVANVSNIVIDNMFLFHCAFLTILGSLTLKFYAMNFFSNLKSTAF